MNTEIFAEWMTAQGYTILKGLGSYWYNQGPRVFQGFPYHLMIEPDLQDLVEFIKNQKIIGLRYSTPLYCGNGAVSYHAVLQNKEYQLDCLGKWARKNVRQGLRNCTIKPVGFQHLANAGWELQTDTLERQGRNVHLQREYWQRMCLAAGRLPGFEAWGAFINNVLTASVITFEMDDCAYMLYQQCDRRFLGDHVNNALCFQVTQEMIRRPKIKSILYGLHSLDAPASVDEFKFRMGFEAKPVRQRGAGCTKHRPAITCWQKPRAWCASTCRGSSRWRSRPGPRRSKCARLKLSQGWLRVYVRTNFRTPKPLKEQSIIKKS
jgi:hypothetical protein